MNLKILLPFQVLADIHNVRRMVVETTGGSYGILPQRLDFTAAILPGILEYETDDGEVFVAVDGGVMVKAGKDVLVSVRRAVAGEDLTALQTLVEEEFLVLDESEQHVRTVVAKLEVSFLSHFRNLQHE